jgi:hypothetical protein
MPADTSISPTTVGEAKTRLLELSQRLEALGRYL